MTMTDFYTAPTIPPQRRPGDVLRMRPVFAPRVPGAAGAWQILYVSTSTGGGLVPASGIVLLPEATIDGAEPVTEALLVYHPGFAGLGGPCAPSRLLAIGGENRIDAGVIAAGLAQGWAVAVVDGEGLGVTGGPHTFLAARAGGRHVLDLARAAHLVPDLDVGEDEGYRMPVVVWGYGAGGRAAAAAGELHAGYAPSLDLRGISAGAVVSDLAAIASLTSTGPYAALGVAALIGLAQAYPGLPLLEVLTEQGRQLVDQARTLTCAQLLDWYRMPVGHWCHRNDPWNHRPWRDVLAAETLAHTAPSVPVHLYHGIADEVVPVVAGRRTLIAYRQRGARVTWREYRATHTRTALDAIGEVITALREDLSHPATPDPADPQ